MRPPRAERDRMAARYLEARRPSPRLGGPHLALHEGAPGQWEVRDPVTVDRAPHPCGTWHCWEVLAEEILGVTRQEIEALLGLTAEAVERRARRRGQRVSMPDHIEGYE